MRRRVLLFILLVNLINVIFAQNTWNRMNVLLGNNYGENFTAVKTENEILAFRENVDLYEGANIYFDRFSLTGERLSQNSSLVLSMINENDVLHPIKSGNIVYLVPYMNVNRPIQIQAVDFEGTGLWGVEGRVFNDYQTLHRVISDNIGGLYIVWHENFTYYVKHLDSEGNYTQTAPFTVEDVEIDTSGFFPDDRDYFACDNQGILYWEITQLNHLQGGYTSKLYKLNINCQVLNQDNYDTDYGTDNISLINQDQLILANGDFSIISRNQNLSVNWSLTLNAQVISIMPFNDQKFYVLTRNNYLNKLRLYEISTSGIILSQDNNFLASRINQEYISSFIENNYLYFLISDYGIEKLFKVNGAANSVELLTSTGSQYISLFGDNSVLTSQGVFYYCKYTELPDLESNFEYHNLINAALYLDFTTNNLSYTIIGDIQPSNYIIHTSLSVFKFNSRYYHRFLYTTYPNYYYTNYITNQAGGEITESNDNYDLADKVLITHNNLMLLCLPSMIILTDGGNNTYDNIENHSSDESNSNVIISNETDVSWIASPYPNGVSLNKIINHQFVWSATQRIFSGITKPVWLKDNYLIGNNGDNNILFRFTDNGLFAANWPGQGITLPGTATNYFVINDYFIILYSGYNGSNPCIKARVYSPQNGECLNPEGTILVNNCEYSRFRAEQRDNAIYVLYADKGDIYIKKVLFNGEFISDSSLDNVMLYDNGSNYYYGNKLLKLIMNDDHKLIIMQNNDNKVIYRIINSEEQTDNQVNGFNFGVDDFSSERTLEFLTYLNLPNHETICYFNIPREGMPCYWIVNQKVDLSYPYTDNQDFVVLNQDLRIYPNPFNPETCISFSVEKSSHIEIEIFNIKGQKVKNLCDKMYNQGVYKIVWDGKDENNKSVGSGVYFCKMKSDNQIIKTRKMMLLK
jgi:hypothetical protein